MTDGDVIMLGSRRYRLRAWRGGWVLVARVQQPMFRDRRGRLRGRWWTVATVYEAET